MKKFRKWIALAGVLALLTVVFAGCAPSQPQQGGGDSQPSGQGGDNRQKEPTKVVVWSTPNGSLGGEGEQPGTFIQDVVFEKFKEKYPEENVEFEFEIIPFDGINERMTAAITSKSTPDVYIDGGMRTMVFANMNALAPVNDMIPEEDLKMFLGREDIMPMIGIGDQIYTYPYFQSPTVLMVNRAIWEAKGKADLLPQDEWRTWTFEEFEAAMEAVADEATGTYGITLFALNETGDQLYTNMFTSAGEQSMFTYDDSGVPTGTVVGESPIVDQVLGVFDNIVQKGWCHPHPESTNNALDLFKQGKNGTIVAGAVHAQIMSNGLKDGSVTEPNDYMYVNLPSNEKGKSALKVEFGNGCVFKNDNAEATRLAKKFYWFMYDEDDTVYRATNYFNMKKDMVTSEDPEVQWLAKLLKEKSTEWPMVDMGWSIKGFSELRAAMFPEMQSMFIGKTNPEETADNIGAKWNEIIQKYN